MRNQYQKIWMEIIFGIGEYLLQQQNDMEMTGIYKVYFKFMSGRELANSKACVGQLNTMMGTRPFISI